jgi:hypothetical protein
MMKYMARLMVMLWAIEHNAVIKRFRKESVDRGKCYEGAITVRMRWLFSRDLQIKTLFQ